MKKGLLGLTIHYCSLLVCVAWLAACASSMSQSGGESTLLENTEWKLLQLGARSITLADYQSEPHMVLMPDQKRVAGSGGCNRLMGSYTLNGDQLKFSQLAGTMMACPKGMETEQQFHQMMESVAKWKILGGKLEFFDAADTSVAVFEAWRRHDQ